MKFPVICGVVATVLVAAAPAQQDPGTKIPRPIQTGPFHKTPSANPIKTVSPIKPFVAGETGAKKEIVAVEKDLTALFDDGAVLSDTQGDGSIVAVTGTYKARFDGASATFVPFFGSDAPKSYPIEFRLANVTVAGQPIPFTDAKAALVDRRVTFNRGSVVETYDLESKWMEQQFRFNSLPQRGELVVTIAANTELDADQAANGGLRFSNEIGVCNYSKAIAIDADGDRIALETVLVDGKIELRVPAGFVEEARLPLVIDPLVGTSDVTIHQVVAGLSNADCAYDTTNSEWFITWELAFSAADHDVYGRKYSALLVATTAAFAIDAGLDSWAQPRVANNNIADQYLVVAQQSAAFGAGPFTIRGKTVGAGVAGVIGAAIVIADATVAGHDLTESINPDVGGDPTTVPPTYYTVSYEAIFTAADHDIHMKQVDTLGALRAAAPTVLDASFDNESNPTVSKSDGDTPFASQRWTVAYQKTFSATDEDIYAALVDWDGIVTSFGVTVDASVDDHRNPSASSPTDERNNGSRYILVAYTGNHQIVDTDVWATVIDTAGVVQTTLNLATLGLGDVTTQPQFGPSVDSTGCVFGIGYSEVFSAVDNDTHIAGVSYNHVTNALSLRHDNTAGFSTSLEQDIEICCVGSGGLTDVRALGAWRDDRVPSALGNAIEAERHDIRGTTGGHVSRANGCTVGGLVLTAGPVGRAILGADTVTYTAPGSIGIMFGTPTATSISAICTCAGAEIGTSNFFSGPSPLVIALPCDPTLVAVVFSAQAAGAGAGCLGIINLSNTIDTTLGL